LGLSGKTEYVAFDYRTDKPVTPFKGKMQATLPPHSCAVWAVRPAADHPQLLSTSRHITQGIVDVVEEKWDADARTLTGTSRVVGGDPYELRIVAEGGRAGWKAAAVELDAKDREAGASAAVKQEGGLVRVAVRSPGSREVRWKVNFTER
jgi:hypothetical protein